MGEKAANSSNWNSDRWRHKLASGRIPHGNDVFSKIRIWRYGGKSLTIGRPGICPERRRRYMRIQVEVRYTLLDGLSQGILCLPCMPKMLRVDK